MEGGQKSSERFSSENFVITVIMIAVKGIDGGRAHPSVKYDIDKSI